MASLRTGVFIIVATALPLDPLVGPAGAAGEDAMSLYEKREKTMKEMGKAMETIAKVAEGELDFGADTLKAAETVERIARNIAGLFPPGSAVGKSRAKPEIWTDWANFERAALLPRAPSARLKAEVETGDVFAIGPALDEVGKTCKSCHDKYRLPKE
jgi:cytochrome c556